MIHFARVRKYLFPFTPIEVEEEPRVGDRLESEWHITIAGVWHDKVQTVKDLEAVVRWLVNRYGDDWYYESSRDNPNWSGWSRISRVDLANLTDGANGG